MAVGDTSRLLTLSEARIAAERERARNAAADERARARTLAWTVVIALAQIPLARYCRMVASVRSTSA